MKTSSELIKEQLKNISAFREILKEQQRCIITINQEGLVENLQKEERIISKIKALQQIIEQSTTDENSFKNDINYKVLLADLQELKVINNQNRILADNSRNFIKTLLTNLVVNNQNLLDRKI